MIRASKTKKKSKVASKKWVAEVNTDSTHPPKGLFTRSAKTIATSLASKRVSPKGPLSGLRMLNYYINRAGQNLSATRKRELEKAKNLLSTKIKTQNKSKDSVRRRAA